jgi:6-phosphogluconolactonase (cycloisomerase 2 family)
VRVERVGLGQHGVVAALHHARASRASEQPFHDDGDGQARRAVGRVEGGTEPGAAGAEDQNVRFDRVDYRTQDRATTRIILDSLAWLARLFGHIVPGDQMQLFDSSDRWSRHLVCPPRLEPVAIVGLEETTMSRPWIRGSLLSPVLALLFAANLYAQNNFIYTNDDVAPLSGKNTVSGFAVAGNGALTPVPGSPFATGGIGGGGGPFAVNRVTTCSAQKLIYASNAKSNDVSGFSVDPSTGGLAPVPGSPFATGGSSGGAIALACTPDGQFLIAANNGSSDITVFRIGSDGALTAILGSPFALDSRPVGIAISPDGRFLAVALVSLDAAAMFSIAPDGTLAPVLGSPFPGAGVGALAGVDVNCGGKLLFGGAANDQTTIVDVFNIATNGALTPLPHSPFPQPLPPFPAPGVGINSNVVLLSPNESLLFVSNQQSQSVTVFSVDSSGISHRSRVRHSRRPEASSQPGWQWIRAAISCTSRIAAASTAIASGAMAL